MVKLAHASGTVTSTLNTYFAASSGFGNYVNAATPTEACDHFAKSPQVTGPVVTQISSSQWQCTYTYVNTGTSWDGTNFLMWVFYVSPACPVNSTGTVTCTCTDPYVPDSMGTRCERAPTCTAVTKLDDITDPVALKYEDGTYSSTKPDIEHLNQATQAGLACIVQKVVATNCYQTPQATSGYRPAAYQKHIYDVYYKWQKIKDNNTPECAEVKAAIKKQFDYHSPFRHAPGETSNHSQLDAQGNPAGNAVDIALVPESIADAVAGQCNMYRPMINNPDPTKNDPVHYQPK